MCGDTSWSVRDPGLCTGRVEAFFGVGPGPGPGLGPGTGILVGVPAGVDCSLAVL